MKQKEIKRLITKYLSISEDESKDKSENESVVGGEKESQGEYWIITKTKTDKYLKVIIFSNNKTFIFFIFFYN